MADHRRRGVLSKRPRGSGRNPTLAYTKTPIYDDRRPKTLTFSRLAKTNLYQLRRQALAWAKIKSCRFSIFFVNSAHTRSAFSRLKSRSTQWPVKGKVNVKDEPLAAHLLPTVYPFSRSTVMFAKSKIIRLGLFACLAATWLPMGDGPLQPTQAKAFEIIRRGPIVREVVVGPRYVAPAPVIVNRPVVVNPPVVVAPPVVVHPRYWDGHRWIIR
jgi:hypothetical protein